MHRTILALDMEGFGDQRRTNPHQVAVRDGVYRALQQAFDKASIAWAGCYHEDRGDGVFILASADVPKASFVEALPHALAEALCEHNKTHCAEERIRLRLALHAGEINHDDHGVTAAAINLAFRLLEAQPLKAALAESPGVLALIASSWFFDEVIRHCTATDAATYRPVQVKVKETSTVGWICLPDQPYPPDASRILPIGLDLPVPRQLPVHTPHFVGRVEELRQLTTVLDSAAESCPVVISAINGTAGIGKTALAVYWARQVADRFPDGQLYVNLRGFDPTGPPVSSAEAVRGFLDAFEVPPERIPVDVDAQAALYRRLLVDRKVLVVLDNARETNQVRPLLPGSSTCRVVITSRNQLTSLITQEGAHPVNLEVLSIDEASALLARHLGRDRVTAEPDVIADLIDHCARLPLALSIVAARAALNPRLPLHVLANELRDGQIRLDALDAGEPQSSVRAVFSWSYQHLNGPAARMFRLLGVHPGPDIALPAAASLAGVELRQARQALTELTRAQLVIQNTTGRYAFHDLLRAYATELADTLDPYVDRRAAIHRVLDHYLHTAHAAALLLYSRWDPPVSVGPLRSGVLVEDLADYGAAWTWFGAEYPVLLAAIQLAAATGHDTHAWKLPWTLVEFFERQGRWHDWVATQHIALASARRSADLCGEAHAHRGLGRVYPWHGRFDKARTHYQQALNLFDRLGDRASQAHALVELGAVFESEGRLKDALAHAQQALALSRAAGNRLGQARALNNIGWNCAGLGDHHTALIRCQQALVRFRELGDRRGEARSLDSIGYAHYHLNHPQQATTYFQQSLALQRMLGDRHSEALVLTHLGDAWRVSGDLAAARNAWQQALDIFNNLGLVWHARPGHPTADQIRAKLRDLSSPAEPPRV